MAPITAGSLVWSGYGDSYVIFTAEDGTILTHPTNTTIKIGAVWAGDHSSSGNPDNPNFNGRAGCEDLVTLDSSPNMAASATLSSSAEAYNALIVLDSQNGAYQGGDAYRRNVCSNYSTNFYLNGRGVITGLGDRDFYVRKLDADGNYTGTEWFIGNWPQPNPFPIAVDLTETNVYGIFAGDIYKIPTATGIPVLWRGRAASASRIILMRDGNFLVAWADQIIELLDPAASVLDTFTLGPTFTPLRLTPGLDDTYFWVTCQISGSFPSGGEYGVQAIKIQVSDGTELESWSAPDIASPGGGLGGTGLVAGLFEWDGPVAVVMETIGEETGTIIVEKVTEPPSDPQVFTFNTTNLSPSTFTLMDGDTQTFNDVAVASGYGISEDTVPNWGTVYTVSNGSPVDNISVADGETVTVTVTNTFAGECVETTYGIRRLRRAPHLSLEQLRTFHHRFTLDLEAGLGLSSAPATAPLIYLRWSDDGGHLWSSYYEMSAGIGGDYSKRLFRNRLGNSRDRIYEISTSDDAVWNVIAAFLETTQGTK